MRRLILAALILSTPALAAPVVPSVQLVDDFSTGAHVWVEVDELPGGGFTAVYLRAQQGSFSGVPDAISDQVDIRLAVGTTADLARLRDMLTDALDTLTGEPTPSLPDECVPCTVTFESSWPVDIQQRDPGYYCREWRWVEGSP